MSDPDYAHDAHPFASMRTFHHHGKDVRYGVARTSQRKREQMPDRHYPDPSSQRDLFTAFAERDEAMERADAHADTEWKTTVEAVILHIGRMRPAFTADDIWDYLEAHHKVTTHEPRALGPILTGLAKAKKIRPTGGYEPSRRRHAAPIRIWTTAKETN